MFVATEIDRTRRLTKRLLEKAQVVEFAGFADAVRAAAARRAGVGQWVQDELLRAGKADRPDAAAAAGRAGGDDISKLRGDVERLLLFTEGRPRITSADVEEVVADEAEGRRLGAWSTPSRDGDAARALRETALRLDAATRRTRWSGSCDGGCRRGWPRPTPARVKPALDALLRTDLALKSSGGDERVLLERLVVELTGRPLAAAAAGGAGSAGLAAALRPWRPASRGSASRAATCSGRPRCRG